MRTVSKTDFMNWSFLNAATFDFAGDAWESNYGAVAEWYQDFWTLRAGIFDLSATPEGGISRALYERKGRAKKVLKANALARILSWSN